jgi:glycosyltransferase involved in cell wall biosynthesis
MPIDRTGASLPSVLVDVRNVVALFNGTTQAILCLSEAIKRLRPNWDVALLANADGAAFHHLGNRYPDWPIYSEVPDRPFTVAFRPSQPWDIAEMLDLHRTALINAYLLLDTIAWDIGYMTPHLESTWQFLAERADGLLFDSEFTRRRFAIRFPKSQSVPQAVTLFSCDLNEYARETGARNDDGFILVVGNRLDHKDVRRTVATLAAAFPFRPIHALGPSDVPSPLVQARASGELSERDVHKLYSSACCVVFPSFYEGFGFPLLTALAHGRTVVARRSALLEEVVEHCGDGRGRLIVFDQRDELVDLIGRLLHGGPVFEPPLKPHMGRRSRTWRDVAEDVFMFLESLLNDPSRSRWIAREQVVKQLLSYRN